MGICLLASDLICRAASGRWVTSATEAVGSLRFAELRAVCVPGRVPSGAWGPTQPLAVLFAYRAAADTTTFLPSSLSAAFLFCWARDITREALQLKQSRLACIHC